MFYSRFRLLFPDHQSKLYLEVCLNLMMELFCDNSEEFLTAKYFHNKISLQIFEKSSKQASVTPKMLGSLPPVFIWILCFPLVIHLTDFQQCVMCNFRLKVIFLIGMFCPGSVRLDSTSRPWFHGEYLLDTSNKIFFRFYGKLLQT